MENAPPKPKSFFPLRGRLFALVALLFFSFIAFGAVLIVLSGGESSGTLSFASSGNQYAYISIPLNANVTSASIDLTGQLNTDTNSYWDVNTSTGFNLGTYTNTDVNSVDANNYVHLVAGNTAGDYNSAIFDTNTLADWNALEWSFKDFSCPTGMAYIPKLGGYCIDQYEASHSDATACANDQNWVDCNAAGAYGTSSIPASVAGKIPWVSISMYDANTACVAAGKRLCTNEQWQAAANLNGRVYDLNTAYTQTTCVVNSTLYCLDHSNSYGEACNTGSNKNTETSNCKSAQNVYDMIGNVHERVSDVVDVNTSSNNGAYNYPNDAVTPNLWGNTTSSAHYGDDGVFTTATKTGRSVYRGGYYLNGTNAGLFTMFLSNTPTGTESNTGFRCCSVPS